jgi:hypothetical protein
MSDYKNKNLITNFLKRKKCQIGASKRNMLNSFPFFSLVQLIAEKTSLVQKKKIPYKNGERIMRKWEIEFINEYVERITMQISFKFAQALLYKINSHFPQNSLYVRTPNMRGHYLYSARNVPSPVPFYSERGYYVLALVTRQSSFRSFSGSNIYERNLNFIILEYL